jgi:hypothetical protein
MKTKCTVIANEQHSITTQQMSLLEASYQTITTLPVPAVGWTAEEQQEQYLALRSTDCGDIIFLSPLPVMLAAAAYEAGYKAAYDEWATNNGNPCQYTMETPNIFIFHNSRRSRREKDGKVWYAIPQDGWELHPVDKPVWREVPKDRKDNQNCRSCVAYHGDCVPNGNGGCAMWRQ